MKNNNQWCWVACRETGDKISCFHTLEEAKKQIEQYETEDKNDGSYTPDFYDIVNDDFISVED